MSELAILGGRPLRTRPFSPWPEYADSDRRRLVEVLNSRNWGGYPFPNVLAEEFARRFASEHGASFGCCVASGTVALTVALKAAGIRFGDEVIVPAYTWDGTAMAVLDAGAVPVFADVDPDTYCLDPEAARRAVTPRTRALMPVHLAMRFANLTALFDVAAEHGLVLVEDCAHVHGGQYNGRGAGSMGDLGCFSFQSSKLMSAGEGGIVITSRLDCFEAVQSLVNCGRASAMNRSKRRLPGSNYRMTEFQAAILLGQLERLSAQSKKRAANAALLTEKLSQIEGIRPLPPQAALTREAIYHYVFQYRPEDIDVPRDIFVAALEAEGIPCDGRFYEPVYRSDLFRVTPDDYAQLRIGRDEPMDYQSCSCPVAERAAYRESVWLPQLLLLGPESDVEDVAGAVSKVISNLHELAEADPALAGVKSMGRADRPRVERTRSY